jgi:hypothetical protein
MAALTEHYMAAAATSAPADDATNRQGSTGTIEAEGKEDLAANAETGPAPTKEIAQLLAR